MADATRYRKPRLTVEQKANVRMETERRNAESAQAAAVRLLDKRHCYATRSVTTAERAAANALVLGRMPNVQLERNIGNP